MNCTILGATGFIGSHLRAQLSADGHACYLPARDDPELFLRDLGHVFYCIGLTADFRQRPFDTVRAHASLLADVLERAHFDSLLYLSSTRVYQHGDEAKETSALMVNSNDPSDLYNLSKLMGESLCLSCGRDNVRVARLSNVYGRDFHSGNFLFALIREAVDSGSIVLRSAPDSAKDYIGVHDVARLLPQVALSGKHQVYNIASGRNVTNEALVARMVEITGSYVEIAAGAKIIRFPTIDTTRVREDFGFTASSVLADLPSLVQQYRDEKT